MEEPLGDKGWPATRRVRPYRAVGAAVLVAIAIIVALALAGTPGPGLLPLDAAFFGTGFVLLVLTVGLAYLYFTLSGYLIAMRAERRRLEEAMAALRSQVASAQAAATRPAPAPEPAAPARPKPSVAAPASPLPAARDEHQRHVRGQPVIDIEGIGPVYSQKLNENGVFSIEELRQANAGQVASWLGTHETVVRQWQVMGELMEVRGIGPQFSELLVRAGVRSLAELKSADAAALLERCEDAEARRETRIQGSAVGHSTVETWIQNARKL